jgi:hypothetical protein
MRTGRGACAAGAAREGVTGEAEKASRAGAQIAKKRRFGARIRTSRCSR